MMQSPSGQQPPDIPYGMATVLRQLERLEERVETRTKDLATRADLEALRKEVVARDLFEPQLSMLKADIARLEAARTADRAAFEKSIDELSKEQTSRSERLWTRLGPVIAALALLITFFEFIVSHIKIAP